MNREPAVVAGVVYAAVGVLVAFVQFSDAQTAALLLLTSAVLAFVVRSQVSPVVSLPKKKK